MDIIDLQKANDEKYSWVARDILQVYAASWGFITGGSSVPDEYKAAKILITDLILGNLEYFYLPE